VRVDDETYHDANAPIEDRVESLLQRMTLREKSYQLTSAPPWWFVNPDGSVVDGSARLLEAPPGHIANFAVDDPRMMAEIVARLQHEVIDRSRLGIPLLIHTEALNGFLAGGHMVFPTAIGLAATWSPDLVEQMADTIRQQMRRLGVRQALSPNMDVALDPRWGRVHETYGEDPYLVGALSVAFVRGLQSPDLRDGVIATAKHFIGYGLPESGMNLSAYEGGPRRTRDLFAFPFEAAIQKAGLASVMNSYSDVDGIPAAVSRAVLTDLLREVLGFTGFVSSDYSTMNHLFERQRVARTPGEAGRLALRAGLDTEFPTPFGFGDALVEEVEAGRASHEDVDRSVRRILEAKFRLGLFENPYPQEQIDVAEIAAEGRELSSELAKRSVVVVENAGVLPLDRGQRVAVIGPHADELSYQFPTYTYPAFRDMMMYMSSGGMGNMVGIDPGMAGWNDTVFSDVPVGDYVRDSFGTRTLAESVAEYAGQTTTVPGTTLRRQLDVEGAQAAAREADVVVLALGGASLWFNGERTEGEGSDSADISLPDAQVALIDAVAATGTPFVVVLFQGRGYALPESIRSAGAVIVAPFGGPFGPQAVADVIFGAVNPSGSLPYSIPRHTGQVPVYHHQRAGVGYRNPLPPDVPTHYLDSAATPLYPFGRGLTYSDFELGGLTHDDECSTSGTMKISFSVRNVSTHAGTATPQLYVRLNAVGVTRPAQQLAGFARVDLEPDSEATVTFTVAADQFAFTDLDDEFSVSPASVDFSIGLESDDRRLSGSFDLQGPTRTVSSAERSFFSDVSLSRP